MIIAVMTFAFIRYNLHEYFAESQLMRAIQDLFIAGTESVGTTMKWALLFITVHTDVQSKVQQELGISHVNVHMYTRSFSMMICVRDVSM
jgi:cytochrome P450